METVKIIRELLYEHDCVIIPGFGAFIGNYVPAHFDRVKNEFQPPFKQIGFNRRLNHNDGLLAGSISRAKQIGYVDAKRIADEFAESLNKKIQKKAVVELAGIGRFIPDKSGKVSFEQDSAANFFPDSFGLTAFHIQPRDSADVARKKIKRFKDKAIQHNAVKKRKYALVAYLGVPVLAAAIALTVFYSDSVRNFNVDISSLNPFSARVESAPANDPLVSSEVADEKAPEIAASMKEMASKKTALYYEETKSSATDKVIIPESSIVHYLVAGSFKNYENAVNLKSDLEEQGFSAEILDFGNDFYRVAMASFSDRERAIGELYKLRSVKEFESVWLLSK